MTLMLSVIGILGRIFGSILDTALGWASSLLFGRVPQSNRIYVLLMMGGALLWMALLVGAAATQIPDTVLDLTPHPSLITKVMVHTAILIGIVVVPLGVGLAALLVPAEGERPKGLRIVVELLRGYLLTPVLSGLLLFLPAVGISRKARSVRHRWSDAHVPIVVKPHGYDQVVADLARALDEAGMPVEEKPAPRVLSLPAVVLTAVAGPNVRHLRADRLVELVGESLRVGVYPSDIAISAPSEQLVRARAAVVSRLATTAAHLTTSAEAQAVEDRLDSLLDADLPVVARNAAFASIDETLMALPVPADEWDILYRLRLQAERDLLAGRHRRAAASILSRTERSASDQEAAAAAGSSSVLSGAGASEAASASDGSTAAPARS